MSASLIASTQQAVNTITSTAQDDSSVTVLTGGGHVITWTSGGDIYARRYDSSNTATGAEFRVNTVTTGTQIQPVVTALQDGGFLIVWGDSANTPISGQRYAANGSAVGSQFSINTTVGVNGSAVTELSDGSLVVTYGGAEVWGQRISAGGTKIGSEFRLNTTTTNTQARPSVTALADGGFVTTWTSNSQEDGSTQGIYGQRYDASGNPVGGEFHVNTTMTSNQLESQVLGLADGGFVVAWVSTGQDSDGNSVQMQRFDAGGNAVGVETRVNSYVKGNQQQPAITALSDGGFMVVWSSAPVSSVDPQDGANLGAGVYGQRYDASGTAVGQEILLAVTTAGEQTLPDVAGRADGGFVATWSTPDASGLGIASRVFSAATAGPVISAHDVALTTDSSVAASAMVLGGHVQGNAGILAQLQQIAQYQFIDNSAGGGHFEVAGVAQTEGVAFTVSAAQLSSVRFVGGAAPAADSFQVRANDGTTWSGWQSGTANTVAPAGSLAVSNQLLVNTTTVGVQDNSAIAVLADGGYVIIWDGGGVFGQRFDASGAKTGSQFGVNQGGSATNSHIVALADGGFLVTWSEQTPVNGLAWNIFGQRFSAAGQPLGEHFAINTTTSVRNSSAALLADGSIVVSYSGNESLAQRITPDGMKLGGEFRLNTYTTNLQTAPTLAALDDGGFVATWTSYSQEDGSTLGIYGQRYDASGDPLGSEFHINTTTALSQQGSQVVGLAGGGFVVAWASDEQDSDGFGVYAQRFAADGTPLGAEVRANSFTTGEQGEVALTRMADGGYMVAWSAIPISGWDPADGSGAGVFGQRYDAGGNPIGQEIGLAQTVAGDQTKPAIAGRPDGGFVASWTIVDSNSFGVASRLFGPQAGGPVIAAQAVTLTAGAAVNAAALVRPGHSQGNAGITAQLQQIEAYEFVDNNTSVASGHFEVDGVVQAAGQSFTVTKDQLSQVRFVGGLLPGPDAFQVRAFDGGSWGAWQSGTVQTVEQTGVLTPTTQVLANTTTNTTETEPTITALANGGYVVIWTNADMYGQVFDASNNKVGGQFGVNRSSEYGQRNPTSVPLADGGFMVTWSGLGNGGLAWEIFGQRFTAAGVPIGSQFTVNSTESVNFNSATALADGSVLVTYSGADVWGQRITPDGMKIGSEFRLNTYTTSAQNIPSVTALDDGGFVATWTSTAQEDGSTIGIYGQRYDANGDPVGSEFHVNTSTASTQQSGQVIGMGDGGFLVAWASLNQDGGGWGIYAQRFDSAGNAVGGEFPVNTTTAGDQVTPAAVRLADNGFVIAWNSTDGSGSGLYYQRYDFYGNTIGGETLLPVTTAGDQTLPALAALTDGGFAAVWATPDTVGLGIGLRRWSSSGAAVNVNVIDGSAAGDTLTGTDGRDQINGLDGDDSLSGGSEQDVLEGGGGADTLVGGAGNDLLYGGTGDDVIFIDDGQDRYMERAGEGIDEVRTSVGIYSLAMQQIIGDVSLPTEVEHLTYTGTGNFIGTGNSLANRLTGGIGNDNLTSYDGNDTLDGGAGNDVMTGGQGNDRYIVGEAGDVVQETAGEGTADYVLTSLNSYTLGDNVEQLEFNGAGDFAGTGNALDNIFFGGGGADTLSGGGGADSLFGNGGDDLFIGGTGNDLYRVQSAGDVVQEAAGEGVDEVRVTLNAYTLTPNVEKLTFTGSGGFAGTGNLDANVITGAGAADTLDGAAGADTLVGGGGNDVYVLDDAGDRVTEAAGAGVDAVHTTLSSYTLGSTSNLEILTYVGGGSFAGTGNGGANSLTGGAGDDTLDGGAGNDLLTGGGGNDVYVVDSAGDAVSELSGGGFDEIRTSLSSYGLGGEVEALTYTGSGNFTGTGSGVANAIAGAAGNDTLDGGAGADTLTGGGGGDRFLVDDAGDVVSEASGGGTDTVVASVDTTLSAHVENLELAGSAISGTGNGLDNRIIGTTGANVLAGDAGADTLDGGAGADTLAGGLGDDRYVVDDAGDAVTETSGEGTDTVSTTLSTYTLGGEVEALVYAGAGAFAGTGNGLANAITGGTGADTLDGGIGADTLVGGSGDDSYIVDDAGDVVTEGTAGGTDTVSTTLAGYTLGGEVEALVYAGTGAFAGTGNGLANAITGGTGGDTLDGGAGADTLVGGSGDDSYIVDDAGDVVTEASAEGTDTVRTSLSSYTLGAEVEALGYTGVGAFAGTGNGAANAITGGTGADTLDGAAGADTLSGGAGDDSYVVDDAGDVVTEASAEGTDTVRTSLSSYTLGADVEALGYTGGGAFAGTGNGVANAITGGIGADTLDGAAGADTLSGGAGDDSYVVDDAGDVVTEASAEGTDTVRTGLGAYTLGSDVEALVYTGAGIFAGTGNGAANALTGGTGADTLDGAAGADTLSGGAGDDSYVVDDAGDVVTEASGEGTDTVRTGLGAYTLGSDVEALVYTGAGIFAGTGNGAANALTGGTGADTLDGAAGADTLSGGTGDDSYIVDDAGDVVTEASGEGTDTVRTGLGAYTLGSDVEALVYTGAGIFAGTGNGLANSIAAAGGADSLIGADGADTLLAAGGADTLAGGDGDDRLAGEAGDDLLTGGAGADLFVYRTGGGADTIQDFADGDGDRIEIAGGMTYTVGSNGSGDAVLDFGAGDTLTLVGRSAGSVDPGWFTTV